MISATALNSHVEHIVFTLIETSYTILSFYADIESQLDTTIDDLLNSTKEWKIHSCLDVEMVKGKLNSNSLFIFIFYCYYNLTC